MVIVVRIMSPFSRGISVLFTISANVPYRLSSSHPSAIEKITYGDGLERSIPSGTRINLRFCNTPFKIQYTKYREATSSFVELCSFSSCIVSSLVSGLKKAFPSGILIRSSSVHPIQRFSPSLRRIPIFFP